MPSRKPRNLPILATVHTGAAIAFPMNTLRFFLLALGFVFVVAGDVSAVTLEVKLNAKQDLKGESNETKKQTQSLAIVVKSLDRATVNAEVYWWFFAKDMKNGKESIFKKGKSKVSLETNVGTAVQSDVVSSTYTEEHVHIEKSKKKKEGGGKGKSAPVAKKEPASGDRLTGYAVQVVIDREVVAQEYSAPTYKDLIKERKKGG